MKKILQQIQLSAQTHSPGFSSAGVRSTPAINLDPILNIDFFKMSQPTFPPHPHAGFSAVTYMLPESPGSFTNRDSLGNEGPINPGDIHWTQAGRGMLHEEVPRVRGQECLGFQIFVNLHAKNKHLPPQAFHASADSLPKVLTKQSAVTLVAGRHGSQISPLNGLATEVTILDLTIHADSEITLPLPADQNCFLFIFSGAGFFANQIKVAEMQVLHLSPAGDQISLKATTSPLRLLVCGGQAIAEPIVWGGPFAMSSMLEVEQAYARFRSGLMGSLAPSS